MEPATVTAHLAQGSAEPAAAPADTVRLYTFKNCPHGQRVRLVLSAKHIAHDIVYINPKSIPDWYTAKNYTGKLPCIEDKGNLIIESAIIAEYLDEVYATHPLNRAAAAHKAYDRILLQNFSLKMAHNLAAMLKNKDDAENDRRRKEITEICEHLENQLSKRGTPFFAGDKPGMLDYSLWPWFERMGALAQIYGNSLELAKDKFPQMRGWWQKLVDDASVKVSFQTVEEHTAYIKSELAGSAVYA